MTSLEHNIVTTLAGEAPHFDELDDDIGPVGSRARLLSLERDSRWEVCYHRFAQGADPVAVVPVYRRRTKKWLNPLYTPSFPGQHDSPIPPELCVVVGGVDGLLSSLHVRHDLRQPGIYRAIMSSLSTVYRERGMYLYFPHFRSTELDLISAALGAPLERRLTGADARLDRLFDDWGQSLRSKQRATLRRDAADSKRLGIETTVCSWADAADHAAVLIAGHHHAKGSPEHPALVDRRIRQWEQCSEFEVLVLKAHADDVQGVLVALIWRDWMDLLEIGLTHGHGEMRRCVYAQLAAHLPAAIGKARGLKKLRAGPESQAAKAARGAFFYNVESGLAPP